MPPRTVSFDTNINVPTEAIIATAGRSRIGEALQGATSGAVEGLNLHETIRKLRNRKKAAKFLADNPKAFGLEQGAVPPEYMEAAIENPSLLSVLKKKQDDARTPFRIGADGRIEVVNPNDPLTAVEAQALLRQKNMELVRKSAEKQYNYAAERLRLAQTAQERQTAQFLLDRASNVLLQATNPDVFAGISGMADQSLATLEGIVKPNVSVDPIASPGATSLPERAIAKLRAAGDGVPITFANGETWVLENGVPKRVK